MKKTESKKIRKSLFYSILDGAFYSLMMGIGESYLAAFAVFFKATNLQLGALRSLPQLSGSFMQLFSNKIFKFFKKRQVMILVFGLLQALVWLPMIGILYLSANTNTVWFVILLYTVYISCTMIIGPAWNSWMAQLVNIKIRGSYFGKRNRVAGIVSFVSFIAGGLLLHYSKKSLGTPAPAFAVLFLVSFVARLFSLYFMSLKYEPRYIEEQKIQFAHFFTQLTKNNYGLLSLYLCMMNFSAFVAAPFFTPFMLRTLSMSYLTYMVIVSVPIIVKFLFVPIWGRLGDAHGSLKILKVAGYLMPMVPLLWLFSHNVFYLVLTQAYSGMTWAGFELGANNFILDTVDKRKRIKYISYYLALNGVSIFFGSLFGTLLLSVRPDYLFVFMASGILRYTSSLLLLKKLHEVRTVKPISYSHLIYSVLTMHPTRGPIHQVSANHKVNKLTSGLNSLGEELLNLHIDYDEVEEALERNKKKLEQAFKKGLSPKK